MNNQTQKLKFWAEVIGLSPLSTRLKQTKIALLGEKDVPKTRFGLSSLSQYHPKIAFKLWRGKPYEKRKVILSNLVNHTPTPVNQGWSVRKTQVLDFRGKKLSYDSHNGTDFAIPVGSTVCAAAAGKVVDIRSEFNRGGLKIFIDHGQGLMTCYAHLARQLVQTGTLVEAGQAIALSGYSGLDALVSFPFGVPHVHFNVWLNGIPTDPFPHNQQCSMWVDGNMPLPVQNNPEVYIPSNYTQKQVEQQIDCCITESTKKRLLSIHSLEHKAVNTIIECNYYPTRFSERVNMYDQLYQRRPALSLPFSEKEFDDCVFLDEL